MRHNFLVYLLALPSSIFCRTIYINNQREASLLTDYPTITGSLVIPSNVIGPIDLRGVVRVDGDFRCEDAQLTTLSSDTLVSIGGEMVISNMTSLSTLSFSKLQQVYGIYLSHLPLLKEPSFKGGLITVEEISIEYCGIISIGNIAPTSMQSLEIRYCRNLTDLNLSLIKLDKMLTIIGNTMLKKVSLGKFPTAVQIWVNGNFTSFRGLENLNSVGQFEMRNGGPHDCLQYSRLESEYISCNSSDSTYTRSKLNGYFSPFTTSSSSRVRSSSTTSSRTQTSQFQANPTTSLNSIGFNSNSTSIPETSNNNLGGLTVPGITFIVLSPVFCIAISAFLFIRHRRLQMAKREEGSEDCGVAELPLGGFNEKVELPANDRSREPLGTGNAEVSTHAVELPANSLHALESTLLRPCGIEAEEHQIYNVSEAGLDCHPPSETNKRIQ